MLKPILLALFLSISPLAAQAHHGWGHYDTGAPLIFTGKIVALRWTNPHPAMIVQIDDTPAPAFNTLPVPRELESLGFGDLAGRVQPAPQGRWELHLAPINRLQAWGLPRTPRLGDVIQGVGFPSCTERDAMRPSLIVLDGQGVRQQSVLLPTGCSGRPRGH